MENEDGSQDCGVRLRHALAFARDVWRRAILNKESCLRIANSLELDEEQVKAAAALLRRANRIPSRERLALVAMRDPGLNDEDIAEMFEMPEEWASKVRKNSDRIMAAEPINDSFYPWLYDNELSSEQILAIAQANRRDHFSSTFHRHGNIRQFSWSNRATAFKPM